MHSRIAWGVVALLSSSVALAFSSGIILMVFYCALIGVSLYVMFGNQLMKSLRAVFTMSLFGIVIATSKIFELAGLPPLSKGFL